MSRSRWLIVYDISNDKRLRRVHRYLRRIATPLQKSVFEAMLDAEEARTLQEALTHRIDSDQDSLEFFRLTAGVRQISLGRPWLPEGIWLV